MASFPWQSSSYEDTDHLSLSGSSLSARNIVFFGSSASLFCVSLFSLLPVGAVAKEKSAFCFFSLQHQRVNAGNIFTSKLFGFSLQPYLRSAAHCKEGQCGGTGGRLVEQRERYGACGGRCSLTDRAAALQYFFFHFVFFLTAGSGTKQQQLCLEEVAKHCLEGCSPVFLATLVLQLCVAGKVEPCKALAVIHWDAAKL